MTSGRRGDPPDEASSWGSPPPPPSDGDSSGTTRHFPYRQNAQWSSLFLTGSQRYVSEFTPHEHLSPGGMPSLMYSFMSPRVQRSLDEPCYSRGVT
jgi:hypothetical protein